MHAIDVSLEKGNLVLSSLVIFLPAGLQGALTSSKPQTESANGGMKAVKSHFGNVKSRASAADVTGYSD